MVIVQPILLLVQICNLRRINYCVQVPAARIVIRNYFFAIGDTYQ